MVAKFEAQKYKKAVPIVEGFFNKLNGKR